MPPHSLFEPVQSVRLCRVQSHATSQSLTSLFGWCTTMPCSEPCHLTVSSSLFEVYDSAVFRAMPPHSLLRACSAGVRLCRVQSHATSQSLTSLFGWCTTLPCSEPCHLTVSYEPVRSVRLCCVQSHATSQSLTSLFGAAYPPYSTI